MSVEEIRRKRLGQLREARGGGEWVPLAKVLKVTASYLSQIYAGSRPFNEKTARKFELMLGLRSGHFDAPFKNSEDAHDTDKKLSNVRSDLVVEVASRIHRLITEQDVTVSSSQFWELIVLAYEDAERKGTVDPDYIRRIVLLMKGGK